jgi:glutathione synthase/RimK-type ligase-like ATP-grasp enzyme
LILIVTNREDHTADFGIMEIQRRGLSYIRFNTEDFPLNAVSSVGENHSSIRLEKSSKEIPLDEVESVWYRRPIPPRFTDDLEPGAKDFIAHESRDFLLGIWRGLKCQWINHPDQLRLAGSKVEQLSRMRKMGLKVPRTVITNDPITASEFFSANNGKVIAKPVSTNHGEIGGHEFILYTNLVSNKSLAHLETVRYSPVIFQERVEKISDIRVTVVGTRVFATEIHSQSLASAQLDWRRNALDLRHTAFKLPDNVEDQCLKLVRSYGLIFGTIDLVRTLTDYVFLELNPNGQWAWIEIMTGQPISKHLINSLSGEN